MAQPGVQVNVSAITRSAQTNLINLNRIVQDLPFGIQGIANNVDFAAESFFRLVQQSGGARNALKAIGSALISPGGLLTAISVVTSALVVFGDEISSFFDGAAADAEKAIERIETAATGLVKKLAPTTPEGIDVAIGIARSRLEEIRRRSATDPGSLTEADQLQFAGLSRFIEQALERREEAVFNAMVRELLPANLFKQDRDQGRRTRPSARGRAAVRSFIDRVDGAGLEDRTDDLFNAQNILPALRAVQEVNAEVVDLTQNVDYLAIAMGETMQQAAGNFADAFQMAFEATDGNLKAFFQISKAFAMGEAVMSTYQAANKALAGSPPPFNYIAAAGVIAYGLANVARIASTQPGDRGGGGGFGSPYIFRQAGTVVEPSGPVAPTAVVSLPEGSIVGMISGRDIALVSARTQSFNRRQGVVNVATP